MEKYHKFIKDNPKVEMIHVSYDESVAAATRWAKKENFPWLSVLPGKKKASGLGKFEATDSVPEYHLINRHGETLVPAGSDSEPVFNKIATLGNAN